MTANAVASVNDSQPQTAESPSLETNCCIVGGGPAGVMLGLLLARKGVDVVLLEAHKDFNRDFRGDTLHPSTMEIMDQLGLADRLLEMPHSKMERVQVNTPSGPREVVNFGVLKTRFPYITLMPQPDFLNFVTAEAAHTGHFRLLMSANVSELIEEDGMVRGVRFVGKAGRGEVRALLTVGADGRFSKVRKLGGFQTISTSPPMDIIWFRIPRRPDDPEGSMGRFVRGHAIIQFPRNDEWQMGYVIAKGSYRDLREEGLDTLRAALAESLPIFAERIAALDDWKDFSLLSVESDRVTRWYKQGLLLIGDAAHVMSPFGGNGINFAIQDAVVAANVLTEPLKSGRLSVSHLAKVQRQREWVIRLTQSMVTAVQNNVIANAVDPNKPPLEFPGFMRWPILRNLPARLVGLGLVRVKVK